MFSLCLHWRDCNSNSCGVAYGLQVNDALAGGGDSSSLRSGRCAPWCDCTAWWIGVPLPNIHELRPQDCTDWCEGRQDDPRSKISPGLRRWLRQETQDLTAWVVGILRMMPSTYRSLRFGYRDGTIDANHIRYIITLYLYTLHSTHTHQSEQHACLPIDLLRLIS